MAMTFLMAPPSCTPVTSVLVYTRTRSLRSHCAIRSATAVSLDATVNAVGRFSATSRAKLGPETTPQARNAGSSSARTADSSFPLPGSSPFVAQASVAPESRCGLSALSVARNAWLGTASRNCCAVPASRVRFASM